MISLNIGQPSLISFSLNLSPPEQLLLTFNENVAQVCSPELLNFQNSATQPTANVSLQTGMCSYDFSSGTATVLNVATDSSQWNRIQSDINLATNVNNTYVYLAEGFCTNVGTLPNIAIVLQATQFTPNVNPPILLECTFDQQSRIFGMLFSEGVLLSSFNPTGVSISSINSASGSRQNRTLVGGTVVPLGTGNSQIGIILYSTDYAAISSATTNPGDFMITLAANSVADADGMLNNFQNNVMLSTYSVDLQNPSIGRFSLDLNVGTISLTFTEGVGESIDYCLLYLSNQSEIATSLPKFNLNGSTPVSLVNKTIATVQIAGGALSSVVSDSTVCTSNLNCFLFWQNGSFEDLNGNPAIEPPQGLAAVNVIGDISPPSLVGFSINLLTGSLQLTFSELIVVNTLSLSSFILTSNASSESSISGMVQSSSISSNGLSSEVAILLSTSSLNFAKSLNPPRVSVQSNGGTDSSGNLLTAIPSSSALYPSNIVTDTAPPALTNFILNNPASRQIVLIFDEIVDPTSWNGNMLSLTLQISSGDFTYSRFTGGSVSSIRSENLTYTFSDNEVSSPFSAQYAEAFNMGGIILLAEPGLIEDLSGNALASSYTIVYSTLPPDQSSPRLSNFSLDMNNGVLQMTFGEPVYVLPPAGSIRFLNMANSSSSILLEHVLVSNGTYSQNQTAATLSVTLTLSSRDTNIIKANTDLCSRPDNCYLSISSNLAVDRSGNSLEASISRITEYIGDLSPPVLVTFSMDLGLSSVSMQFSEPVIYNESTPDLSRISLIRYSSAQSGVNLSSSNIISTTNLNTVFEAAFPSSVFNAIILDQSLCTNTSNCFLRVADFAFVDTSGNQAMAGVAEVSVIISDTVSPSLLSYDLDLDTGVLTFVFNEPMDIESFNPDYVNFTSSATPGGSGFSITGAEVTYSGNFSTELVTVVNAASLSQIKVLYSLEAAMFGLSIASSAISDVSGNQVIQNDFLQPANIVIDTTSPMLTSFRPGFPMIAAITFLFDEPVNISSFEENAFTITLRTRQGAVTYSGFSGGAIFSGSATSDEVTYNFSQSNFNLTVREQFLEAIMNGSVYLLVTSSFITDLFQNPIIAVPSSNPLQFTNDITRPRLVNFILDLNRETIYLYFSEPVIIISVAGLLSVQSSAIAGSTSYTLIENGTLLSGDEASESITILLDQVDSISITSSQEIATSVNNTYLQLQQDFGTDINGNEIPSTTLQASDLILDTARPNITSFQLDIDRGLLNINFSEIIPLATLDLSRIFLTGSVGVQSLRYNLTGSCTTDPIFSKAIAVMLSVNVLNMIKLDPEVCTVSSNCSLFVQDGAFSDVSGNLARSSSSNSPQSFISDTTSPVLSSFLLDLDSGRIVLNFTEPILLDSLCPSQIAFHALSQSVQLDDASIAMVQFYATEITLSLNNDILDRLKILVSTGPISLSITSNAATDTSSNPISPAASIPPNVIIPDITPPIIIEFIPSAGGQLSFVLVFDEPIQSSSVSTSNLSFTLKNRYGHLDYMDLSSAVISVAVNSLSLIFSSSEPRFTDIDFQELYLISYTEGYICFNLAPSFVSDINGNPYSGPITILYTNSSDNERPRLLSFSLDLNRGYLNLTFTEDVNILSVVGNARLQSNVVLPIVYDLNQERGILYLGTNSLSSTVSILLNSTDVAVFINNPLIGSSVTNTYLVLQDDFAVDSSGNFLNTSETALQASQVVQFVAGTSVTQFSLDLDSDILTIDFDKGVNISTFNSSHIVLTNVSSTSFNPNQARIQLGAVDLLTEPDFIVTNFRFILRVRDAIQIKSSSVCSMVSNCFTSFMTGLILDVTGNSTRPAFLQVASLSADVTPPRLVAFTIFDLNRGTFTLVFSEPVNGSSADFTDVQLWNQNMNPTASLTLTQGSSSSLQVQVQFQLASNDLNLIKSVSNLCTSIDNCWIRLLSFFVYDFAGNPFLHSNLDTGASSSLHQPVVFIPDTTAPNLVIFSVDINNGTLYLSFDEVIDDSTFSPLDITLLNMPGGSVSLQLSTSTIVPRIGATQTIFYSFTEANLNQIKSLALFTSRVDSYLSLMTTTLVDTSGNVARTISSADALQASAFNTDFNQPQVTSFDQYNNDVGSLTLRFNEPIDINTFSPTQLTLFSQPSLQSSQFTLTGGVPSYFTNDGLAVLLSLTTEDLRVIKINTGLATSRENTYITISSSAVTDRQGNSVQPLLLPLQLSAGGYIADTSRADLSQYSFDLNRGFISLSFSDVMDFRTFNIRRFTIQNQMAQPSESYALTSLFSSQRISDTLSFQLLIDDLDEILSNTNLASSTSNTFVSFEESLVRDVSGLQVIPIPSSNALPPNAYVEDQTSPEIALFNLDLNIGLLQVTFSEPVEVSSIRMSSLALQTTEQAMTNGVFVLTDENFMESGQNTLFLTINFTPETLNVIKSIGFQSVNSSYLSVQASFGIDTSANPFLARVIQVSTYIRDSVPPSLLDFDLNFNQNNTLLQIKFSEAISYTPRVVESITLQSAAFNPSIVRHLSISNTIRTLPSLDAIEVTIMESSLLFALLNNPGIASSTMNLFISISMEGFRDFAGNDVIGIPSDSAQRVRYICKYKHKN